MQFEEQEEDAKAEEDGKMDVDKETDCRKKLEMRKRYMIWDMRQLEGTKGMDEASKNVLKEGWQRRVGADRTEKE